MITKVKEYIEKYHMINPGDKVIVGLSGGADSVCLLFLLHHLSGEMGFSLSAVHVNHKLREEADGEADFVKELCRQWNVELEIRSIEVREYAKEQHLCIEEAARSLRYGIFEEAALKNEGAVKIALAHHQNDQAETVLFHLFRGSGIRGLAGIRPVRDNYIRPLLCVEREEIEAFLAERGLSFVTDASNFDTAFARNKIRHDLLPMAEKEICNGSIAHIAQSAELMREAADFLEDITEQVYKDKVKEQPDGRHIDREELENLPPYLKSAIIYKMLYKACGKKRDIARVHVDSVEKLLKGQSGRRSMLIYGMQAVIQQRDLVIRPGQQDEISICGMEALDVTGASIVEIGEGINRVSVKCRLFSYEKTESIPQKPYTKWFDYDKINNRPVVRTRQEGDFFYCGERARKKLKDFFINEKIPLLERDNVWLIADDKHIMWILGHRISNFYKITDETKRVLEITVFGGKEHE
ncbi:MAG: tRNA lysidine(34) synthetase TilS [Lachnospiraceae bacterium]|nr:tRNA lysidine(34) synthetase TilS [Lachnospiraceae bacterium]